MPGPTLTEIVRKLGESVSTLFAVAEHAKENLSRVEAAHERTVNALAPRIDGLGDDLGVDRTQTFRDDIL